MATATTERPAHQRSTTDHYRAYAPRPFTRAERESVTILFGGLHWRVERILQAVLESGGHKAQVLPVATRDDLLAGRPVLPDQLHHRQPGQLPQEGSEGDQRRRREQEVRVPDRRLLRSLQGVRLKLGAGRVVQAICRGVVSRLRRAMGNLPRDIPHQLELRRLAAPYFHSRLDGGEGDMLVGKAIWAHQKKKAHMICELSPYSCMPDTMSVGAMAGVIGRYPDLLYTPLEIKGDAEVHALSRCQIRVETITHYLEKYAAGIIQKKMELMPPGCPLL